MKENHLATETASKHSYGYLYLNCTSHPSSLQKGLTSPGRRPCDLEKPSLAVGKMITYSHNESVQTERWTWFCLECDNIIYESNFRQLQVAQQILKLKSNANYWICAYDGQRMEPTRPGLCAPGEFIPNEQSMSRQLRIELIFRLTSSRGSQPFLTVLNP